MKKILLVILKILFKLKNNVSWIYQFNLVKSEKIKIDPLEFTLNSKQALVIIPHADDELIGCYQLSKVNNDNVSWYYIGFLGSNSAKDNAETRLKELKELKKKLNIELYVSNGEYVNELKKLIFEKRPDIIAVPYIYDWHLEHLRANTLLSSVLTELAGEDKSYIPSICMYQISLPISERKITHYLPMTKSEQLEKWNIFSRIYKSQKNIPVLRFMLQERIPGELLGHYAAEVYIIQSYKAWLAKLNNVLARGINGSEQKKKINNIKLIRNESKLISDNME